MLEAAARLREAGKGQVTDETFKNLRQLTVTLRGHRVLETAEGQTRLLQTLEIATRCGTIEPILLTVDIPPHEPGLLGELEGILAALRAGFAQIPACMNGHASGRSRK
jgi:hypothetical protein